MAREFDGFALGIVLLLAGLFALLGRLNPHPATSLVAVAVLSATGCGLLTTALRKLRTFSRPGLLEAASGGLFLALFQFAVAISYPNVIYALSVAADQRAGFLYTWLLIGIFSVLFSIAGAALGHLAFAPLRPLPAKKLPARPSASGEQEAPALTSSSADQAPNEEVEALADHAQIENKNQANARAPGLLPGRALISYVIAVALLGLAPTLVGYAFAAAFDYMLQLNLFFAGPYPTLRLLGTLLPWQIPIPFTPLGSDPNSLTFLLWQFWRIPLLLGNPTMFDIQALEPYVFNAAALGLLLITARNADMHDTAAPSTTRWPALLLLEIFLGLLLTLPADLFIVRGLHGLLQDQFLAVPIRTLIILNPFTFTLNLICGPLICAAVGVLLYVWLKRREI